MGSSEKSSLWSSEKSSLWSSEKSSLWSSEKSSLWSSEKSEPMVKRKVKALLPIEFRIKYCRIHPGIGIARLGNSHTDYFLGPEVFGYGPQPKDGLFKDSEGMVKRQAVRFRIYAYDSNDRVVKEITSNDASVTWKVPSGQ